jgi:hypothetical protein
MDRETKVTTLALIVSHGHGDAAPNIALHRAREYREAGDYASAFVWLDVVLRLSHNAAKDAAQPTVRTERRDGLVAFVKMLAKKQDRGAHASPLNP